MPWPATPGPASLTERSPFGSSLPFVRVRVASYNLQNFRAGVDAAARAIGPEQPDVLLLQECGPRRKLLRFRAALEMEVQSSHRPFSRNRNAVLYRSPWRSGATSVGTFTRESRTLPRGFIVVHLRRSGEPLTAVSTHLGLSPKEREQHARELTDVLSGIEGPLVVGADLNEGPESPAARWIGQRFFDALVRPDGHSELTFPARVPTVRIDFLFVNEAVRPLRSWVGSGQAVTLASDHRPVLADLEVRS